MKTENRTVVRLRTTTWADSKGLHLKRSLTYLRRKCCGFNGLEEDTKSVGAELAITSITNLAQCKDGIYEVIMHNISRDWESGHADCWDYKIIPILSTEQL